VKAKVVDLSSSSDEEGLIIGVSWDEEFTRRLFGDLNCDIFRPPGDGKIIIFSDSDEEEEKVREEKTTSIEDAATSPAVNLASIASADDAPTRMKNNNSDDRTLDQEANSNNGSGDDVGLP
jgi:hypothetical protein